jgi:two-component system sensor histidine kinase EvgS
MDGFDAAIAIREEGSACQRVPIIAVTAGVDGDEKERCERAGMDALLEKPFSREGLRQAVARWLQQGQTI